MQPQHLALRVAGELTVDLCADCQAIWFDALESTQLAPGATLRLFEAIRTTRPAARRPLPATLPCPRCTLPLSLSQDLQHTRRFFYYRCSGGHARFTRSRNSSARRISSGRRRRPSLRLKASIREISCSSCGAPIELERDAACPYCRAPIAILDPDAIEGTVRALESAEARRTSVDVGALVEAMLDAQREARGSLSWSVETDHGSSATVDLIRLGLDVVAGMPAR